MVARQPRHPLDREGAPVLLIKFYRNVMKSLVRAGQWPIGMSDVGGLRDRLGQKTQTDDALC